MINTVLYPAKGPGLQFIFRLTSTLMHMRNLTWFAQLKSSKKSDFVIKQNYCHHLDRRGKLIDSFTDSFLLDITVLQCLLAHFFFFLFFLRFPVQCWPRPRYLFFTLVICDWWHQFCVWQYTVPCVIAGHDHLPPWTWRNGTILMVCQSRLLLSFPL